MTDLTFEIDNISGVGARLAGQYSDWTIESVEWWNASGSAPIATGQSLYTPETMTANRYHAVIVASNPEGTETVTLTSANISGTESTVYGAIYREFYVEELDGQIQVATSSFGNHNLTGFAFHSQFRDGAPNNIYVTEANGVFTEYQYDTMTGEQGYIAAEDREDAFNWTYLTTLFSDGEVTRTEEVRDDGVLFRQNISAGKVTDTETTDQNDAYNYAFRYQQFDDMGGSSQWIEYDDGRILERDFVLQDDGSGTRIDEWIMVDRDDAYSWNEQYRVYDESNTLSEAFVVADDGVLTHTTYEEGVRVEVNVNDIEDARNFTSIIRQYDNGVLTNKVTQLDDGRVNHSTYDSEGQRTSATSIDTADAFVWAEQTRTFDADGNSEMFRLYDNGVQQTITYQDGERTSSVREDAQDALAWHSITDQFEDGVRVSRDIIWDSDLIG